MQLKRNRNSHLNLSHFYPMNLSNMFVTIGRDDIQIPTHFSIYFYPICFKIIIQIKFYRITVFYQLKRAINVNVIGTTISAIRPRSHRICMPVQD